MLRCSSYEASIFSCYQVIWLQIYLYPESNCLFWSYFSKISDLLFYDIRFNISPAFIFFPLINQLWTSVKNVIMGLNFKGNCIFQSHTATDEVQLALQADVLHLQRLCLIHVMFRLWPTRLSQLQKTNNTQTLLAIHHMTFCQKLLTLQHAKQTINANVEVIPVSSWSTIWWPFGEISKVRVICPWAEENEGSHVCPRVEGIHEDD